MTVGGQPSAPTSTLGPNLPGRASCPNLSVKSIWRLVSDATTPPDEPEALASAEAVNALCMQGQPLAVELAAAELPQQRMFQLATVAGDTLPRPLSIKELNFDEGGLGHKIWEAAIALAIRLAQRPSLIRGKRVLELGAGVGVSGLAAALVVDGETSLTLSDLDQETVDSGIWLEGSEPAASQTGQGLLTNLTNMAAANGVTASTMALDWHACLAPSFAPSGQLYDLVLAADCIYASSDAAALAAAIYFYTAEGGTAVVLSRAGRAGADPLLTVLRARFGDDHVVVDDGMSIRNTAIGTLLTPLETRLWQVTCTRPLSSLAS